MQAVKDDKNHRITEKNADAIRSDMAQRTWEVGNVTCVGRDMAKIEFGSGGNCSLCAQEITYAFSPEGKPRSARLSTQKYLEDNRVWMISACPSMVMNAWDKLGADNGARIDYTVKTRDGKTYSVSRTRKGGDSNTSQVVFPDDFRETSTGKFPFCQGDATYDWSIAIDGAIRKAGTMRFTGHFVD
jgi:hypothetical protein